MKRLTVKHPWAAAMFDLDKRVENRTVSAKYRGPIAIHVALEDDKAAPARVHELLELAVWTLPPRGHIIGVVDLVDVHSLDDCTMTGPCAVDEDGFSWAVFVNTSTTPGRMVHHWILADARELQEPIEIRGELGLRDLSREIEARIFADLVVKREPAPPISILR